VTTVRQYVSAITDKEQFVCGLFGVDVSRASSTELRAINLLHKVWLGGLMKALVDKGLLTDAEISAAIDSTLGDAWQSVPLDPPP
jgi:hypothetical protein